MMNIAVGSFLGRTRVLGDGDANFATNRANYMYYPRKHITYRPASAAVWHARRCRRRGVTANIASLQLNRRIIKMAGCTEKHTISM